MKLIEPSFEIIEQAPLDQGLYKHIELCGRVCYKSEDKITEDSAKSFVNKICKGKHGSVLEHGTIYLKIPNDNDLCLLLKLNPYTKCKPVENICYATTNFRVLVEHKALWLIDKYSCEPTEHHEKRISVRFICSRSISHELVRHRVFSFSQESQRYCNYSKDKFDNELTFIKPLWYNEDDRTELLEANMSDTECIYFDLLNMGCKPEEAREVLPNSTKTEIIMTGFVSDWENFFKLRTAENAHPEMKRLAIPLKEEFIKRGYIK